MCGILALLQQNPHFSKALHLLKNRGPDCTKSLSFNSLQFGFQRLKINDLVTGMQPFDIDDVVLICNGEIYNHQQLKTIWFPLDKIYQSTSDCEIIIYLYKLLGISQTLKILDGVFAFVLYDKTKNLLFACRDRIGVRPLFIGDDIAFSSEAKALEFLKCTHIHQLSPGSYIRIHLDSGTRQKFIFWKPPKEHNSITHYMSFDTQQNDICNHLEIILSKAVEKRLMSDRPIGCLLSGGLDSSIIAALLAQHQTVNTYSIGFKNSPDLLAARKVAKYINSNHHEVVITPQEALAAIPDVIYAIESYDITTVRASVPMYLLCKHIKKNYPDTVIFSGEGSDELLCGYLYFHLAKDGKTAFDESRRLISDIYLYDVLRADRSTASNGLELRVPFLDKDFVYFCMTLDGRYRKPYQNFEKYYLRKAFAHMLPDEIAWRRKDGMSDGISLKEKPWYSIIQDFALSKNLTEKLPSSFPQPHTTEALYYYLEFKKHFTHTPITYHWMPKWSTSNDPSGRLIL